MAKIINAIHPSGQTNGVSTPKILAQMTSESGTQTPNAAKSTNNCQSCITAGISAKRQLKKYAVPNGAAQTSNTNRSRVMRRYSRLLDSKPPSENSKRD